MEQMEVEVIIQREVYYKEEDLYGIYACETVDFDSRFKRTRYGNFTIQGTTRRLAVGENYKIKCEGSYSHPKHGIYYKLLAVEVEVLDTVTAQDIFLKAVLTIRQFTILKTAYPDVMLVDFILEDKIDTSLTSGIKAGGLAKIKEKIRVNIGVADLIAKLSELEISQNKLKRILVHYGDAEKALFAIDANIYNLCDIKAFGFKTVDAIAMKRGDDPQNQKRIVACIMYHIKNDMNDGHTWSIKTALLNNVVEILDLPYGLVETTLNNIRKSTLYQKDGRVALMAVFNMEIEIFRHLKRIHDNYKPPKIFNIVERMERTEAEQGFNFTEEQSSAIIEGSQHGVMILNGLAGAGKTATVKGLIDSLEATNYMTAALSGKAVNILAQRGIKASTIHRMLKFTEGRFLLNENLPLNYDVIVLDEMSMNDIKLVHSVLCAIPNGAKLILVGDSGQLPAIGSGDVLRDLLDTYYFPKFELTQVHRQAAKSGILSLANNVRSGVQVFPYNAAGTNTYGELQDQTVIAYHNKESILKDLLEIAQAYNAKMQSSRDVLDFQVIVPNKERGELSVKNINQLLQAIFNGKPTLAPTIELNGYNYKEGDKIITQGNLYRKLKFLSVQLYFDVMKQVEDNELEEEDLGTYEFDLFNGTLGFIERIVSQSDHTLVFLRFEGHEGVVALYDNELEKIEMAYAATVHRLQGSSIKNVLFALDFGSFKLLSKQLVYTALTRASKRGVALVETKALFAAIKNDASNSRRTFLAEIIETEIDAEDD